MPAATPITTEHTQAQLIALGEQIRARRKALKVSATVAAEAAGLSRVTLHRIEKGEPSVTMGAWANVWAALGMALAARPADAPANEADMAAPALDANQWIPARVRLVDYPQLKALAWQVHGTQTLSPLEAQSIYERNARHLDAAALSENERALMQALNTAFGASAGAADV